MPTNVHWVKSAEFSEDIDLSAVDARLHHEGVKHRITFESGKQVLWIMSTEDHQRVVSDVIEWLKNPNPSDEVKIAEVHKAKILVRHQKMAPLTLVLMFFSYVGATLAFFDIDLISPFSFWDPNLPLQSNDSIYRDILDGEYWRLVTPIFLHFGLLHIVFNTLWLWYLGSMIENLSGYSRLLTLVFFIALFSNIAQAAISPWLFGGMSGVIFGLLSYVWLGKKLSPDLGYQLSDALFYFMTAYMLLSALGLLTWAGNVEVADTAHIVGYISGMIAAVIIYWNNSKKTNDTG